MARTVPLHCPACGDVMHITELTCPACDTRVQGQFAAPGLHRLSQEQLQFVEVFLRCRGNIREVERDLGISYPTVRARLDAVIQTMGYPTTARSEEQTQSASDILQALDEGSLTFEDALAKLTQERGSRG